jgi:exodeoxyribonuclease VII small subunit
MGYFTDCGLGFIYQINIRLDKVIIIKRGIYALTKKLGAAGVVKSYNLDFGAADIYAYAGCHKSFLWLVCLFCSCFIAYGRLKSTAIRESNFMSKDETKETKMSFEEAMAGLEEIIRQLEGGKVKLEDAVLAYEKGARLRKICEDKLADAKMKIEKVAFADDGKPEKLESFEV